MAENADIEDKFRSYIPKTITITSIIVAILASFASAVQGFNSYAARYDNYNLDVIKLQIDAAVVLSVARSGLKTDTENINEDFSKIAFHTQRRAQIVLQDSQPVNYIASILPFMSGRSYEDNLKQYDTRVDAFRAAAARFAILFPETLKSDLNDPIAVIDAVQDLKKLIDLQMGNVTLIMSEKDRQGASMAYRELSDNILPKIRNVAKYLQEEKWNQGMPQIGCSINFALREHKMIADEAAKC